MRAVVIHAERDLRVETVETPALGTTDVRVRIEAGGICGSDLHYYQHGGFGVIRLREPMVLGHEIAGRVEAIGAEVTRVKPGDRVAVNPSRPCGQCRYCQSGAQQHCLDMRFFGSAMRFPHVQGGFREQLVVTEHQAVKVADHVSAAEAAFAEPLAVCLHAAKQAGPLLGKKVLVTGSGPIGALCVVAARAAGASEIVTTDVVDAPLPTMLKLGATRAVNVVADPAVMTPYSADKGHFDVLFEASGNQHALVGAFDVLRPGAVIVQVGLGGTFTLPINTLVAKEFQLRGTFRFHEEFAQAVDLIGSGRIDLSPLLTATLPIDRAVEAFELAGDRARAMKVQIAF
ncbi:MAG: L-idonate 5-dehydrogenase [Bosea sp. (in: a-proteobacteria)]